MSSFFFSIILPVYNVEKYLEECLDSLRKQDIKMNEYEIICIDDGSTDSSPKILDVYARREPNIVVINQGNLGVSGARNTGIEIAKGEYIWFVDPDDFVIYNVLSRIMRVLKVNSPDLLFIKPVSIKDGFDAKDTKNGTVFDINSGQNYFDWLWTRFYRRSIILSSGIRFYLGIEAEDNLFCNSIKPYISRVENCDIVAYCYRIRENSISTTPTEKKLNSMIRTCKAYYESDKNGIIDHEVAMSSIYEFLIPVLAYLSVLPLNKSKPYIDELKRNGLFPLKKFRSSSDNLNEGQDYFGCSKLNRLKSKAYTQIGYRKLRLYRKYQKIKKIVSHIKTNKT